MRYIEETTFIGLKGEPFVTEKPSENIPAHDATTGEMLALLLLTYDTNHDYFATIKKMGLSAKEIARFNFIDAILEAGPSLKVGKGKDATSWWEFEDQDFNLLKKLLDWCGPEAPWWRQSVAFDAMLTAAAKDKPGEQES